jgi:hypothetical protein
MTPSDPVERATIYSVPIGLPEEQIEIVSDEIDSVLIGLTQDLVHLDGKPDPGGYVGEVAAYGRLAAALTRGTMHLPDRACRKALERLAEELDNRNEYERVRSEHQAFRAFGELLRTPRPSPAARKGRS